MRRLIASFLLLAVAAVPRAGAQSGAWPAYAGCWSPGDPGSVAASTAAAATGLVRCILPGASADRATILTVQGAKVLDRQEVIADGAEHVVDRDGCQGTERATWTGGGARLIVRGALRCASGPSGTTTSIFDIVSPGGWVQVAGVRSGASTEARPQWYRRAGTDSTWPAEVRDVVARNGIAGDLARVSASADPDLTELARIATTTDESVVRAWLVSRAEAGRRGMPMNGETLVKLADAGVSGTITDALVALANPDEFEFRSGTDQPGVIPAGGVPNMPRRMGYSWANDPSCMSPWSPSAWMYYSPSYGGYFPMDAWGGCAGRYAFGYAPFGRGWSLGLAYGYPYGSPYLGYGGGWFWTPVSAFNPVPRVDTRTTLSRTGGYVPRGNGQDGGRTATPHPVSTSGTGSSTTTSSGTTSSGGGRTAVKKP
ncbi:MAG: hypothetical protein HY275_02480 [Gemmatimonadetes bacterium]|nr:hypothetical protein [Gemmatimonadota bacterium]